MKVRLVYDYDKKSENYYKDTLKLKDFFAEYNTDEIYDNNNRSAIMHNKFFIFDDKKVWTGSANVTDTDLSGFNANYVILMNSTEIVNIYKQEFEQMLAGKFHKDKSVINKNPVKLSDKTEVRVLFSPKDNIIDKYLIKEINNAKEYIYMPIFFITSKELIEPLINAHKRGVDIKIIDDATNAHNKYSIHKILRESGISVKTENMAGKMHMKGAFTDNRVSVLGSMNFTKSGNLHNDENVLIIYDEGIAKYLKSEFMKVWNRIPEKYLKFDPYPESYESIGSCSDGIDNDYDGKVDKADEGCKR
mgnify:CR=1 FL=1